MLVLDDECLTERYELCADKMREISKEAVIKEPLLLYFKATADFIIGLQSIFERAVLGKISEVSENELAEENQKLYEELLPENYEGSYANPDYVASVIDGCDIDNKNKMGQYLCFLYTEIRGLIPFAYEGNARIFITYIELFTEIYTMFRMCAEDDGYPSAAGVRDAIYWFESDNCDIVVADRIKKQLDPEYDFATDIIMNADLNNTRYLYLYGEYVSKDEIETARFLSTLPEEDIDSMARTFTEGYRIGFVKAGKPLDKKISVNIRYSLGFERITRRAVMNFKEIGLAPVIYRAATLSLNKRGQNKIGYVGGNPNRQYDFDHKDDEAIYLDADFVTRKIEVLKESYESMKKLANGHAGPAVQEVFGEEPFEPVSKAGAVTHNDKTRKLSVDYQSRSGQLVNEYIIGEERSFTIIAYPIPSIGSDYRKIFEETVKLNTLDYKVYEVIQQKIIDVLDKAGEVRVKGKGDNRTDLCIKLCDIKNPEKETKFENCVADVNIPLGEVFTSPRLTGTNGRLHVTGVYLNGLFYKDFEVVLEDGMVKEYSCANFEKEEDNAKYMKDNFLFSHDTLPIGEFAIGTNTVAYKMSRDYGIEARLPILIGEKTGPHFAFGDTCYSHEEDVAVYNSDGKEIIARENEVSAKRKTDEKHAYFQCHTDVTIPYDELGSIIAVTDGEDIAVFEDGRFVLEGCEELNKSLKH